MDSRLQVITKQAAPVHLFRPSNKSWNVIHLVFGKNPMSTIYKVKFSCGFSGPELAIIQLEILHDEIWS